MAVFRVHKTKDFTVMSNHHLRDKNLTLKAKGLLSVILSLPDDWKYSIAGLAAICKEGQSAVKSALQELTDAGYVTVTKLYPNQTETGRIEYIYDIHERPQEPRKQGVENLHLESQQVENQGQLNTDVPSTDKPNTKNQKKERKKPAETYDSIIDSYTENGELRSALVEFVKMRKMMKKPLTNKALSLLLTSKKGLDGLASNDAEKIDIVQQSIMRGWQGFFPLKDSGAKMDTASHETSSGFNRKIDADYYYQSTGDEEVDKVLGLGKYAPNRN